MIVNLMVGGFVASLLMILTSEIGDKTFIIEAILSSQGPKSAVFFGTMFSMTLMTFIGAYLGAAITLVIDPASLNYLAALVFLMFSACAIREAFLKESEEDVNSQIEGRDRVWISSFTRSLALIFLAEWGDRSQLATIALAAQAGAGPVILGALFGHAICSLIAVLSGKLLTSMLSYRCLALLSSLLFLLFAVTSLLS